MHNSYGYFEIPSHDSYGERIDNLTETKEQKIKMDKQFQPLNEPKANQNGKGMRNKKKKKPNSRPLRSSLCVSKFAKMAFSFFSLHFRLKSIRYC